ncbi:cell division protein SepF [Allokutzneria albata]|uniref:Cell division protein SepF n=1 Tax=Allokutzneria albata TaxID=211114 RepID=A0A1G9X2D1_ALLAB|nr:cell division protein SepF [Allokutzneria albata]SDM90606.1 cell division inhibitor SepF [Allokutzneria albata]
MSGLQKLKAYFGMVPADEVDYDRDYRRGDYSDDYAADTDDYEPYPERSSRRRRFGRYQPELADDYADDAGDYDVEPDRTRGNRWAGSPPTRGALAVEPDHEPVGRVRPPIEHPAHPLSRITTLHPRSYSEARTIGEHYRDGIPVIINLTEMDNADARRLVDFSAGLAFALRGAFDKVTNKVFLLSPPNVDVTAEDRRRIAEGGFLNRG